jgi:hypothetical protein
MDKLFICFNAFLLLFIFLLGGGNKITNFKSTVHFLETKINAIQLNLIFIIAIAIAIFYFYMTLLIFRKASIINIYLFFFISLAFMSIPIIAYFKKALGRLISLIYDLAIAGIIGLLTLGSLLILYSLYTSKYEEYAYVATIGLAVFTAMTILIFHFPTNPSEMISFTKNLSIFGGLMLLSERFVH